MAENEVSTVSPEDISEAQRSIAISALYELSEWALKLQRLSVRMNVEDSGIVRGMAVRIFQLQEVAFRMIDPEGDDDDLESAAQTVFGTHYDALDDNILRTTLSAARTVRDAKRRAQREELLPINREANHV